MGDLADMRLYHIRVTRALKRANEVWVGESSLPHLYTLSEGDLLLVQVTTCMYIICRVFST